MSNPGVPEIERTEHRDINGVGAKAVVVYGYDGTNLFPAANANYATKVTVSGSITYVGKAAPGSAQASAVWQAMKVDESSGVVVTWADGNTNFDNVATDLTLLTYS